MRKAKTLPLRLETDLLEEARKVAVARGMPLSASIRDFSSAASPASARGRADRARR